MHSRACKYFEEGSVMVILRPLEVQGKDISKSFIEWEPESTKYAYRNSHDLLYTSSYSYVV